MPSDGVSVAPGLIVLPLAATLCHASAPWLPATSSQSVPAVPVPGAVVLA